MSFFSENYGPFLVVDCITTPEIYRGYQNGTLPIKSSSILGTSIPKLDTTTGISVVEKIHLEVSLNYCSQNGGKLYRAPYYNGNPNIGPRIIGNLDQSPFVPTPHVLAYSFSLGLFRDTSAI